MYILLCDSKINMKMQRPGVAMTTLKYKNELKRLPDFKAYAKTTAIKTVLHQHRMEIETNGIEFFKLQETHTYIVILFLTEAALPLSRGNHYLFNKQYWSN